MSHALAREARGRLYDLRMDMVEEREPALDEPLPLEQEMASLDRRLTQLEHLPVDRDRVVRYTVDECVDVLLDRLVDVHARARQTGDIAVVRQAAELEGRTWRLVSQIRRAMDWDRARRVVHGLRAESSLTLVGLRRERARRCSTRRPAGRGDRSSRPRGRSSHRRRPGSRRRVGVTAGEDGGPGGPAVPSPVVAAPV